MQPLPTIPEHDTWTNSDEVLPPTSTCAFDSAYYAKPQHSPIPRYIKPPPRLIDIDPLLLSNLEIEVLLHLPLDVFPRPYLLQLAERAASHFVESGRYPGWGATFDVLKEPDGRIIGVNYRFENCVCGGCPEKWEKDGWVGCPFPQKLKRY